MLGFGYLYSNNGRDKPDPDQYVHVSMSELTNRSPQPAAAKDDIVKHQFSRKHARTWGVSEAIVLSYFAERVRSSKHTKEGKRWFYNTLDELLVVYPYFKRSTLAGIIQRMVDKKLVERGNFNRWKQDRTGWYHVSDDVRKLAAEDPIYFRVRSAALYGICGAAVLDNLENNILKQRMADEEDIYHRFVPSRLATLLPWSDRTIERAIDDLSQRGIICQENDKPSFYTFTSLLKTTPTNPDKIASNLDEKASNLDEKASNLDNVTHCKPLETIEKPFKTDQAAPAPSVNENPETGVQINDETFESHKPKLTNNLLVNTCRLFRDHFPTSDCDNVQSAFSGCTHFLATFSAEEIYNFSKLPNRDALVQHLAPRWQHWFNQAYPATLEADADRDMFFHVALDMVVTAFTTARIGESQNTTLFFCSNAAYQLTLDMLGVLMPEQLRQKQLRYEHRAIEYASPDEDKENVSDLAPAEKARILRNSVSSRNDRGWLYEDGEWAFDKLVWSHAARHQAERFFNRNPNALVSELLEIIDACVRTEVKELASKGDRYDPYFYSRKGVNAAFLFTHMGRILGELGMSKEFVPYDDAEELVA
jgi:hypothetical protein